MFGVEFSGKVDMFFIVFDGGCFWYGESWLKLSGGWGFCWNGFCVVEGYVEEF